MTINLEGIKEELRNKQAEMWTAGTGSGFALLVAESPGLAALGIIVGAYACLCLGIKDGSSGRKLVGWGYGILAGFVFLIGAGTGLAKSDEGATERTRKVSGMILLVVLINPTLARLPQLTHGFDDFFGFDSRNSLFLLSPIFVTPL